jgi:lipoprotein-anchoring transpeptidase ErfK/SrfK
MSSLALAALVATASVATAPQAEAQGLFEFLWGGGQEWGGGRQNVAFDQKYTPGQVIVSFGDRRLYLITKPGTAISYPVAVPREVDRWQGTTSITDKRVNPSWRPTPEMLRENPKLPLWVPGGHRMNPLGVRAMYLGSSMYRIHGTDAPWTIGQAVSKGCIRMLNEDVLDLYPRVPVGTKVTVTWQHFSAQSVAASDEPAPYMTQEGAQAPTYKSPARAIRPHTPAANVETIAATSETGAPAIDPNADDATLAAAAQTPLESKPVKKAEVHKKAAAAPAAVSNASAPAVSNPAPHAASNATAHAVSHDPASVAEKAAAAAEKAAVSARAAAEAAKKAAEDAKKATEDGGKSASL